MIEIVLLAVAVAALLVTLVTIELRLRSLEKEAADTEDPGEDIHYGIGTGWQYDREGSR